MGAPCPTNATAWSYSDPVGGKILLADFNQIITAINREVTRRGTGTALGGQTVGAITTAAHWQAIANNINAWVAAGWNCGAAGVNKIQSLWTDQGIKYWVNQAEIACVCNCNYACTCVCNYCTCACNYCVCNCNYACTCVCNYLCTCNCNNTSVSHNP